MTKVSVVLVLLVIIVAVLYFYKYYVVELPGDLNSQSVVSSDLPIIIRNQLPEIGYWLETVRLKKSGYVVIRQNINEEEPGILGTSKGLYRRENRLMF